MTRLPLVALIAALGLQPAHACEMLLPVDIVNLPLGLPGTEWRVETLDGKPQPDGGPHSFLGFGNSGAVTGSGPCNSIQGEYGAWGDGIAFGSLFSTRSDCGEEVMAAERLYLDTLQKVTALDLSADGRTLTLTAGDGTRIALAKLVRR